MVRVRDVFVPAYATIAYPRHNSRYSEISKNSEESKLKNNEEYAYMPAVEKK